MSNFNNIWFIMSKDICADFFSNSKNRYHMEFRKSVYSKLFCALSEKKTTTTKVIRSLNLSHSLLHTPKEPKPLWIRILDCNSPTISRDLQRWSHNGLGSFRDFGIFIKNLAPLWGGRLRSVVRDITHQLPEDRETSRHLTACCILCYIGVCLP